MSEERRANPNPFDIAGILSVLYTAGYLVMVGMLYFIAIPPANKEPLLQLFGLMSAIQMALISFHFGSSKNAEATQRAIQQREGRAEAVVQDIAKSAAPVAAAAVAAARAPAAEIAPSPVSTSEPMPVKIVEGPGTPGHEPLNVKEEQKP